MEHEAYVSASSRDLRELALITRRGTTIWKPPAEGRVKVNWDTATNSTTGKMGI